MSDAPPVGKIRLHDAVVPELTAGRYRVTSTLKISAGGADLVAPPAQLMHVQIDAARFAIDAGGVAGRHPEIPSRGAFGNRLPHLVLGRRTLPWERRGPNGMPWLALLVVAKSEATLGPGTVRTALPAPVVAALEASEPIEGDPVLTVLRFNGADVLRSVLPTPAEVALLCHVRQVNLGDTEMAGTDDDGWFAVVTANRLPLALDGADTEYLACLVSLEAREDLWGAWAGQPPALVVLHSWSFTSASQGGTIEHLLEHLDVAAFGGAGDGSHPTDANGAIAIQRNDREGGTSTVHYRGPLRGASSAPLPVDADDVSRDAARELGRLLGSADARFLRELVAWHRDAEAEARAGLVAGEVAGLLPRPATRSAALGAPELNVADALSAALSRWSAPKADLWLVPPGAAANAPVRARRKPSGAKR
jgi:hypothetical protein